MTSHRKKLTEIALPLETSWLSGDVEAKISGSDVEGGDPDSVRARSIEVKRRADSADMATVTESEVLTALNKPDAFIPAIVEVSNGFAGEPRYIRRPFQRDPGFGATSVTYKLAGLVAKASNPS